MGLAAAMNNKLMLARLGPQAEAYLRRHFEAAVAYLEGEVRRNPGPAQRARERGRREPVGADTPTAVYLDEGKIVVTVHDEFDKAEPYRRYEAPLPRFVGLEDRGGFSYMHGTLEEGMAAAHLLSVSQLCQSHHGGEPYAFLSCDVSCHGWTDGTRFVGVRAAAPAGDIHRGVDVDRLLAKKESRDRLWVPTGIPAAAADDGFYVLKAIGGDWFTQYAKKGEGMDTGAPEYAVAALEPIGGEVPFSTDIRGYHAFFRYGLNEVRALAPEGANAYVLGDVGMAGDRHVATVRFYRAAVDRTRRLPTDKEVRGDFGLMLRAGGLAAA